MSNQMVVQSTAGPLSDEVRTSPADQYQYSFRRRIVWVVVLIPILILGYLLWYFKRDQPVEHADMVAHFKYGSIGSEPGGSLFSSVGGVLPPYWVFRTLPAVCPEKLPGGYTSLGLIYEPGQDLPIGVSRRKRLGLEQVGLNCSVCHTGTVRQTPAGEAKIVVGMPAHQLDLEGLFQFVLDCSLDERLTADSVIATADAMGGRMGWMEKLLYRATVIGRVKAATVVLRNRIGTLLDGSVPRWGPGRVDTFNPYKSLQFNWRLDQLQHNELIGAADFPSLWNQEPREGMHLHWDGNNTSVDERNLSASLGAGVTPVTVDHQSLKRIHDYIWTLPPPTYPFNIDQASAARGKPIYERECAECHSFGAKKTGQVEDIASIGTDRYRLDSYTYLFATSQASLYPASDYRFKHFQKTNGYANQPLDGVWARAPYLHNGSVPALRDLLEEPERRPKQFIRGYDVYDQERVGFVSGVKNPGFLYDTTVPGNGNAGHLFGTKLADDQKRDLVEYLKTL
jgi:hypothetical protein